MVEKCLSCKLHHPRIGTILEVVKSESHTFTFYYKDKQYGPFYGFFTNGDIIEFEGDGFFLQFFMSTEKWFIVHPYRSEIIRLEKQDELNLLIFTSLELSDQTPQC